MHAGGKSILIFLLSGFIIIGCQSSVRYSSTRQPNRTTADTHKNTDAKSGYSLPVDYSSLSEKRYTVMKKAESLIGSPYCYGGYSTNCFDCSGFIKTVYENVGIEVPRISKDIYSLGESVSLSEIKPGDLVFFSDSGGINHVGIASGNNEMIHASTSRGVVRQSLDDKYFSSHFAGAKRIIH